MKPGETVRFGCDECHIAVDLCIAPVTEWVDEMDEDINDPENPLEIPPPSRCPFCESESFRPLNDRPLTVISN